MAENVPIVFRKGGEAAEDPMDIDKSVPPIFRSGSGEEKDARDYPQGDIPVAFRSSGGEQKQFKFEPGALPVTFRSGDTNNINYSWIDTATGTGYKILYGAQLVDAATTFKYALNWNNQSSWRSLGGVSSTEKINAAMDVDFDILFSLNVTLQGDAYLQIPVSSCSNNAAPYTQTWTIILYKVAVGGAETQLGSSLVKDCSIVKTYPDPEYSVISGTITIPLTKFTPGQKLRLNITTPASPAGTTNNMLYHDPKDAAVSTTTYSANFTTQLNMNVPFKVYN